MENGSKPATRQDIEQLRSEFQHGLDDLKESVREGQAEILKAFYSFAESNQARLTGTEQESAALKQRIGILERRLTDVERMSNFPDHPTE